MDTKEKNRLYMREYRKNIKILNSKKITPLNINTIFKDTTITQYINIIKRNHEKLSYFNSRDINIHITNIFKKQHQEEDLRYVTTHMKYLNSKFIIKMQELYDNGNTLKSNLIPYATLLGIIKEIIPKYEKLYQIVANTIISLNKNYEKIRDDNYVSNEDKLKIITDFSNETITDNINKLDTSLDKVIYSLYMLLPPRRLEYSNVYLVPKTFKNFDNDKNYLLYSSKNRFPESFVFNYYKTSRNMGRQKIQIPEQLSLILHTYIIGNNIYKNNKLFDLTPNYLGKHIKTVFTYIYDADINLNYIRKSWATYINNLDISNNEKTIMIEKMAHGFMQSQKYKKLI